MLEIKTNKKGAELESLKFNGFEKIHDAQKDWNRHSPVLFPIVGKLKDGKTLIENNTYEMGQHGFARDMEFEEIGENSYVLKSNEETLKKYPYEFELYIKYVILDKNTLSVQYKVVNKELSKMMIFGFGAHPAFKCDYTSGKFFLEFQDIEKDVEIYQLENGLVKEEPEKNSKFIRENRIFLDSKTFENDAIIFKNIKSRKIYLKTDVKTIFTFEFDNFPYLGVWSKPGASFVCIEPWMNTADKVNSNGIFEEKEDLIELKPGEEFKAEWSVHFFD